MALTRIELINHALGLGQLDSSFQTLARGWCNILLEKLSIRTDYPFYRVRNYDTAFTASTLTYALPANFQRPDSVFHVSETGVQGITIPVLEPYIFDQYVSGSQSGTASVCMIDITNRLIVFNAVSAEPNGKKFRMNYFRKPTAYSTTSSDDATVMDFEDQQTLIDELVAVCHEWQNDDREQAKKEEAKVSNQGYQRNMLQTNGSAKIDLNTEVFRSTRRRNRQSGFGR